MEKLLQVLHRLVDNGNTVIVIEHNLDVIKTADWLIDLGPEGGARGGEIVGAGTPEEIAATPGSATGEYLARVLRGEPLVPLSDVTFAEASGRPGTVRRSSTSCLFEGCSTAPATGSRRFSTYSWGSRSGSSSLCSESGPRGVLLLGLLFALTIEGLQLIEDCGLRTEFRTVDINDVALNWLGVAIGLAVYVLAAGALTWWLAARRQRVPERP